MSDLLSENMGNDGKYDEDVEDIANLAIAIENEDYTTKMELFLQCKDLPKMDAFSYSDPRIIVSMEQE